MRYMMNYRSLVFLLLLFSNAVFAQWEKVMMPGSRGGAVYSICLKDSLMFAGRRGGVFVSKDAGEHWSKINPDLPSREYNAIVTSLATAGESIIAAFNEPGVFISPDEGENWSKAEINEKLRYTPYIIAADENWIIGANRFVDLYQSHDYGITWEEDNNISNSLSADIRDSVALVLTITGIYRSTDYGSTWENVYPLEININSPFEYDVSLADSLAFVGISNYSGSYIFRSSNRGVTWNDSSYLNCTSVYSIVLCPNETGANFVFAGTDSGLYRSSDYGINWALLNDGLSSNHVLSLAFQTDTSTGTAILYAATGDGIFSSSDYGETWNVVGSPSEWLSASTGSDIFAVSSNEKYRIPDDTYQTVIYHSTDDGVSWSKRFSGYLYNNSKISSIDFIEDGGNTTLFASIEGYLYEITAWYSNIVRSKDYGQTWERIYPDTTNRLLKLKVNESTIFVSAVSPSNNIGSYLIRSTNYGESWDKIDSGYVSAFSFNDGRIFIGRDSLKINHPRPVSVTLYNNIEFSTDNGLTWMKVNSPLDSGKVINDPNTDTLSVISSLYASGSHLLVGMRAYYFYDPPVSTPFAYGGVLFHLVQGGDNWIVADSSLIGRSVFAFESSGSNIYAATETGVYHSSDFGSTWNDISVGMENIYVSSLFKTDSHLYALTINGIWRRPLSEITAVESGLLSGELPTGFSLSQNYPNPFNPTTTIKYKLPVKSHISLKVYDILGREVTTLVNREKPAETYTVQFHASGLASGVYFYQLNVNDFVETKKLLLLK